MGLLSSLKKFIFEFGIIGGMTGFIAVMPGIGTTLLLTTMYGYSPWLAANPQIGVLIFVSVMTILCGLALLAINFVGVVSGFAFGFQLGLAAHLAGILGAATLMFVLAKRYAANNLEKALANKPKLQAVQKAILTENVWRTFFILILARLSFFPFAATNFLVSASGISYKIFVFATIIGLLPRAVALVFVGSSLSELSFNNSQDNLTLILGILATILMIILISLISKRTLQKITSKESISALDTTSNQFQPND
jgi:uncharacterized membrane protein YdjX (TVP38/TMEM64 family)